MIEREGVCAQERALHLLSLALKGYPGADQAAQVANPSFVHDKGEQRERFTVSPP